MQRPGLGCGVSGVDSNNTERAEVVNKIDFSQKQSIIIYRYLFRGEHYGRKERKAIRKR